MQKITGGAHERRGLLDVHRMACVGNHADLGLRQKASELARQFDEPFVERADHQQHGHAYARQLLEQRRLRSRPEGTQACRQSTRVIRETRAALVDVVLYLFMPDCLSCYRCGARYRGEGITGSFGGFDLETHEKHRQQLARMRGGVRPAPTEATHGS